MNARRMAVLGSLSAAFFLQAAAEAPAHAARMAGAARAFLATLAPAEAAKARYPFEARAGLALKSMAPAQREAALALLKAGLSEKGYAKVETIRSLEDVLAGLEGSSSRDPGLYTLAVFGEPSESGTWGLRYEGHHVSLNWTLFAAARMERLKAAGLPSIRFAWMGGFEKGQGHYYRIQGATFLVEYDDTQNGANHVHTVWRDFDGDFGEDLLAAHYRSAPHAPVASGWR
jgi:hypothetical protein